MKTQNNKNEPNDEKSLGSTPCSPSVCLDWLAGRFLDIEVKAIVSLWVSGILIAMTLGGCIRKDFSDAELKDRVQRLEEAQQRQLQPE